MPTSPDAKPRFLRIELLAAVAIAAAALGYALRPAAHEVAPSRVAVVDLEKVFNSLDRYGDAQARLKEAVAALEKQVADGEAKVKELESELDSYQPGSDAQAAAVQKLQLAVGEFRATQQFVSAKIEMEQAKVLRDTYLAIKDAARRFAEGSGYDYVMLDDSVVTMDPASAQKTMAQISARRFIYANPKADVTGQLVGFMNEEWKAAKGG